MRGQRQPVGQRKRQSGTIRLRWTGNSVWVQAVVATAGEGSARKTKGAGQRCVSDGHDRLWANETRASQAAHRSGRRAGRRVRGSLGR